MRTQRTAEGARNFDDDASPLDVVRAIMVSPLARDADRLRAAKLVYDWEKGTDAAKAGDDLAKFADKLRAVG